MKMVKVNNDKMKIGRIAMVGDDKSGKTTLLHSLIKEIEKANGINSLSYKSVNPLSEDNPYICCEVKGRCCIFADYISHEELMEKVPQQGYGYDGAVVVVPVGDCDGEKIKAQLALLAENGMDTDNIIVYISKADLIAYDDIALELIKEDICDLLEEYSVIAFVSGCAKEKNGAQTDKSVQRLAEYIQEYFA